MLEHDIYS